MVVFLLAAALAQRNVAAAPRLVCEERICDFGELAATKVIRHSFRLTNAGDAPLTIERIRVCCGARSEMDHGTLAPGGETNLVVFLSLMGRNGQQRKSIYVVSDDPQEPYYRLQLVGTATSRLVMSPDRAEFGDIDEHATVSRDILVTAQSGSTFHITDAVTTSPSFSASWRPIAEGRQYAVTVKTVPPLPSGFVHGLVHVQTDAADYPQLQASIAARVDAELVVVPREIVVRPTAARSDGTRYLALRRRTGKPFRILETQAPHDGVKIRTSALGAFGYRLALTGLGDPSRLVGTFLTIRTDVDGMEELDIPFRVTTE